MSEQTTAAPTTPTTTTTTQQQQPPPSTTRRSARVHKRDPVIAPGFGTYADLENLANALGQSVDFCKTIMEARGRGIRRNDGDSQDAPPVMANAWASFLQEDDDGAPAAAAANKDDDNAKQDDDKRIYQLPIVVGGIRVSTTAAEEPPKKKAKSSSAIESGVLVQAGTLDSSMIGRTKRTMDQPYDLQLPTVLSLKLPISTVISSCNACHALALTPDGQVYGWGRNDVGQLGSTLPTNVVQPTLLEVVDAAHVIIGGAVGKWHTIVLDKSGQLYSIGQNKAGQCGIKSSTDAVPNWRKCVLPENVEIVQVSCGEAFSVALSSDGHVYTCGSSEYGQLANGETGEYIVTAGKTGFANESSFQKRTTWCHTPEIGIGSTDKHAKRLPLADQEHIRIGHVDCGKHHAVAVEAAASSNQSPRVFSWGCGNYGCLGHGIQADEYFPREVLTFSTNPGMWKSNPPIQAIAGASCSMILTRSGHVYYCGKHRSADEAKMRPTLLAELANNGHVVTHVGAGAATVVCSTANAVTVSWGQGPHGELGLEGKKSSSKPQFVSTLDKCRMLDLACGYGTTYWVVKNQDKDDEAAIKSLPVVDPKGIALLESKGD